VSRWQRQRPRRCSQERSAGRSVAAAEVTSASDGPVAVASDGPVVAASYEPVVAAEVASSDGPVVATLDDPVAAAEVVEAPDGPISALSDGPDDVCLSIGGVGRTGHSVAVRAIPAVSLNGRLFCHAGMKKFGRQM
jgi:hypothetical protein